MIDEQKAYTDRMRARVDAWAAQLDKLSAEARQKAASGRVAAAKRIEALRHKQQVLGQKLEQLRAAGLERFEDARQELDELANEVRAGFNVLTERLRARSEDRGERAPEDEVRK